MDEEGAWDSLARVKDKKAGPEKFEVALEELEKIVNEMEAGDLALEKLIERYEEGMRLVKICGDKLAEAEQKIEILTKNRPSISSSETSPEPTSSKDSVAEDDASLF